MPLDSDRRCVDCFRRGLASFLARTGMTGRRADRLLEGYLDRIELDMESQPPPVAGAPVYREIREMAADPDIYGSEKAAVTRALLGRREELAALFLCSGNALDHALRACTWGNLLDVAQGWVPPSGDELVELFGNPLAVDDTGPFLEAMDGAGSILILGDNAGETVLDRIFLELAGFRGQVVYAVRPHPVLNDATEDDAVQAGLHDLCTVISTGYDAPTVLPERIDPRLREFMDGADLVLSKGQGNLEGLFGISDPRLYYSFVVKCPVIADATGIGLGCGVFASSTRLP